MITVDKLYIDKKNGWKLELLAGKEGLNNKLSVPDINRCGLALTGYLGYFPAERIQIIGKTELSYLRKTDLKKRKKVLDDIFKYDIPLIIVCNNLAVSKYIIEMEFIALIPLLMTSLKTTRFIIEVTNYLQENLAQKTNMHGVLLDVYGVGVMLTGKGGIGKSECALELIKRGHRLVADDLVELYKTNEKTLIGHAQKLLKFFLEVRGLGVVNVKDLFGVGATRDNKRLEMVVCLEEWNRKKPYERLGNKEKLTKILNVGVPKLTIPIKPGRNIAVIVEVAAMQERLKKMGYYSTSEFEKRIKEEMQKSRIL
jgi:HPr kinase/phosphorylase